MSSSIIPLPKDTEYSKGLLFQLGKPIVLPVDQFDEVWPLVCNVFAFRRKSIQQNGAVQVELGKCRLKEKKAGDLVVVSNESMVIRLNAASAERSVFGYSQIDASTHQTASYLKPCRYLTPC